jgi:glycosyltransferase involved in cell wall biosynthesis
MSIFSTMKHTAANTTASSGKSDFQHLRVLSLSTVFPNPAEPGLGLFVQRRLQAVSRYADLTVLAPVPLLDYSSPLSHWTHCHAVPEKRADGALTVLHPRWAYPPGGTLINPFCLFSAVWPLARRLHQKQPFDLLDSHFGFPEGIAAWLLARALRLPFTVTLRANEMVFGRKQWHRRALAKALGRANRVITVSSELAHFAASLGVERGRVKVIGNGVNTERFRPRDRQALRRKYGIAPDRRVMLSAGSLVQPKGHHRVIQALAGLQGHEIDAELLIVGRADRGGRPFDQHLEQLSQDLGVSNRVRFLGWMPPEDLAGLMAAADLFCHASDMEGWPNVVHEALACGTPVVALRAGSVPDLIPSDDTGYVVTPGSQQKFSAAVAMALNRPWDRQRIAAWGGSRSWDDVAREVVNELRQAAGADACAPAAQPIA